jgi:LmbE family N-acetylglucosaminyl deacetylase
MKIIYKKIFIGTFLFALLTTHGFTQTPPSYTSAEILLQLKKLNTLGSVLYVAAHPDDENTRLLAYLSKEKLYRTGYLSLTRGDGGQNLIGDEQGVELGLIRTQELLAARRIDGAEQFFTRAYDFGFSKTTEEALRIWDKEKILYDVVWVIRKFQPDVIITRFPEDSRAGHGQHSGSAVLAHEAFKAAADPKRFPDQFKYGVQAWQAKRIVWNTFIFGNTNTTSDDQFKLDVGVYNAVLGKSYGEIAAESRSLHKSQGFGVARSRGQAFEYFTPVEGAAIGDDLTSGVNAGWQRIQNGEKIQGLVDQLIGSYSITNPEKSVPSLVNLYKEMSQLKDDYWRNQKLKEVQRLIEMCSGLWIEATTNNPYAVVNDSLHFNFLMNNRLGADIILRKISIGIFDSSFAQPLQANRNFNFSKTFLIPASRSITQPYWLERDMDEGSFNVGDLSQIGNPEGTPAFEVQYTVRVQGCDFTFTRPVQYKFTDPVKGEIYQPVTVLPARTGRFEPSVVLLNSSQEKLFDVITRSQSQNTADTKPLLDNPGNITVSLRGNFQNSTYSYGVKRLNTKTQVNASKLSFEQNGKPQPAYELRTISYDHIPRLDYFHTPTLRLVSADIKIAGKRIGYIEGAGDKVPDALEQMGYEVILLKEKDIVPSFLKTFDAVITGIRAYNIHEYMNDKYEVLMDYVKEGGNLIVQYNTSNFISSVKSRIGPYPFSITRNRVTEERTKVNFIDPSHTVLNYPNKITETDFDNWVQERGIYFAGDVDPRYETVLSMKDTGEQDQKGSLIIAGYGQGKFVYTGLVFFRQLPAGVPGAYRLLANIIALNKKQGF